VSLHPESLSYDDAKAFEVLGESVDAARQSDLLIAYLPEASMGSAIEMWEAKKAGARIISITPLKPNWVVRYASDIVLETIEELEELLRTQALDRLLQ
jgi:DNA-binding MurR/RpiR family transcriptional regulator